MRVDESRRCAEELGKHSGSNNAVSNNPFILFAHSSFASECRLLIARIVKMAMLKSRSSREDLGIVEHARVGECVFGGAHYVNTGS